MENDYTCPICVETAKEAVESSCCGQVYCLACANMIKSQNGCPLCKHGTFQFQTSKLARRLINSLPTVCPNPNCGFNTTFSELSSHLAKCPAAVLKCNIGSCTFSSIRNDFLHHVFQAHETQIIDFCKKTDSIAQPNTTNKDYMNPLTKRVNC